MADTRASLKNGQYEFLNQRANEKGTKEKDNLLNEIESSMPEP